MGHSVESFVGAYFAKLDALVSGLTKKTYWALWIGAIAIALSLLAHTPYRSLFRDVGQDWRFDVFRMQIAHPFTPIDLEPFKPAAQEEGANGALGLSHLDKIAFRFSIPLIGKALHTGAASFLVLNYAAGLLFFPMLAQVANGKFRDRITAAYVTFAFALSWAGTQFLQRQSPRRRLRMGLSSRFNILSEPCLDLWIGVDRELYRRARPCRLRRCPSLLAIHLAIRRSAERA